MFLRNGIAFFFFIIAMTGLLFWLYQRIDTVQSELSATIERNHIDELTRQCDNIARCLHGKLETTTVTALPTLLQSRPDASSRLSDKLSVLLSERVRYAYILYLDDHNKFRFVADGLGEMRPNQRFMIENPVLWQQIYQSGQPKIIDQSHYQGLWKTLLYPIRFKQQTIGLIVIDFSDHLQTSILETIASIQRLLALLFYVMILISLFGFIEMLRFYRARHHSYVDALTQLYNRRYLNKTIQQIDLAHYALMMIDIDHFKRINDTYGHAVGDVVLTEQAALLKRLIGRYDKLFRYGGEEFLILIHKDDEPGSSKKRAEHVLHAVRSHRIIHDALKIHITVSIGLNTQPHHARNAEHALKQADQALYAAKQKGRDCLVIYDENQPKNSELLSFERFKNALENDAITAYVQPVIDIDTGKTEYFEVLARCLDPQGNVITPDKFLHSIWNTTVYNDFTHVMIGHALDYYRRTGQRVGINLDLRDLMNPEIAEHLVVLCRAELDFAANLIIELHDTHDVNDFDRLKAAIHSLKYRGVLIAIDDFGSGFSNFNTIVNCEVDIIKIDGHVIESMQTHEKQRILITSIVQIATSMGIKVVAKLVSNETIKTQLERLGVMTMQGFALDHPKPFETDGNPLMQ